MFLIVFVISYVHLGFMLHLLLFNESLLHCLSIKMVFSVCMDDSVHRLYISISLYDSCKICLKRLKRHTQSKLHAVLGPFG